MKDQPVIDAMDLAFYRHQGHLTVNGVFAAGEMDALTRDIEEWGASFLAELPAEQRAWYGDGGVKARTVLRKLDNPHFHRDAVKAIARDPRLVGLAEQFIGSGVSVYFSQIFFKAPEGGGPKPAHQDNYYFGPTDIEGVVTAWIALDDATEENGCLDFIKGSHKTHTPLTRWPHRVQAEEGEAKVVYVGDADDSNEETKLPMAPH